MKQRDRNKARRTLLRVWQGILQRADALIEEDRAKGEPVDDALQVRRSIMRRISRLKRLINQPLARPKKNGLHRLQNDPDNAPLSGVRNA